MTTSHRHLRSRTLLAGLVALAVLVATPHEASAHDFGSRPLDDVLDRAAGHQACGLSRDKLAAMMLSVIWPETGAPSNVSPSPMTLSRYDDQDGLYSFGNRSSYQRAFWHPGVGLWQFDSAGAGAHMTAHQRINTYWAADEAARVMRGRYCAASGTDYQRRKYAWGPWVACSTATDPCQNFYVNHYNASTDTLFGIVRDAGVGRYGGMVARTCRWSWSTTRFTCWYVNPAWAQGYSAWASPGWGNSPVTHAFYNHYYAGTGREYRHWLRADTAYDIGIYASRPMGTNARHNLGWSGVEHICDTSTNRGAC